MLKSIEEQGRSVQFVARARAIMVPISMNRPKVYACWNESLRRYVEETMIYVLLLMGSHSEMPWISPIIAE